MTVAFDAFDTNQSTADPASHTHTPVGTPRAVIAWASINSTTATLSGVTYGGVAMTEVTGSPNTHGTGEGGIVQAFFLGSSIPTGAQTVSFAGSGVQKRLYSVTLTAADDTETVDTDGTINSDSLANPSVTLSLAGRTSWCGLALFSGIDDPANITQLANWTNRNEADFGVKQAACYTYDTIASADVAAGWTQAADDAVMIAVAISEIVSAAGVRSRLGLLGVG